MCTDEQWTRKHPTEALMTSKFWLKESTQAKQYNTKGYFTFWLTPLQVPEEEKGWVMQFPGRSLACSLHSPAKLK